MSTYNWSLSDDVEGCQAARIESIGVWRRKLCDFGEERGIDLLNESGLGISSLSFAGGFTGSEGNTFNEAVDDALDAVRAASELQAGCLVVVSGARGGHTHGHVRRLLRDALRQLGDAAGEQHVQIALQPMHRSLASSCTFLHSLDRLLDFLAYCNHPQVGILFDTYQLSQEVELAGRVRQALPFIKLVALNDARRHAPVENQRCVPGEGMLPLAEWILALEGDGYRGLYETQILSEDCWRSDYTALLERCRQAFQALCPVASPCHTNS